MASHSIGTHNATYVAPLTGSKGGAKTSFAKGLDKTAQIQQSHFGTLNASMNQAGKDFKIAGVATLLFLASLVGSVLTGMKLDDIGHGGKALLGGLAGTAGLSFIVALGCFGKAAHTVDKGSSEYGREFNDILNGKYLDKKQRYNPHYPESSEDFQVRNRSSHIAGFLLDRPNAFKRASQEDLEDLQDIAPDIEIPDRQLNAKELRAIGRYLLLENRFLKKQVLKKSTSSLPDWLSTDGFDRKATIDLLQDASDDLTELFSK